MFKAYNNHLTVNIENILKVQLNIISSRRKNMFSINYSHINLRRACTPNVEKRLWNDLPVNKTNISSIYLFKKNIKRSYLQCY